MTLLRRVHRIIVAGLLGAALVAALLLGSAACSGAASSPPGHCGRLRRHDGAMLTCRL